MKSGYVYFIKSADKIKIGFSKNSSIKRLADVLKKSPDSVPLGAIESDSPSKLEKTLHDRYKSDHIQYEWFKESPELLQEIEKACTITSSEIIELVTKHRARYSTQQQVVTNDDEAARMTPEEEFKIYLLYKEGKKNEEIVEKAVREDGSKWSMSKIIKLRTKFNKGHVPQLNADKAEDVVNTLMGIGLTADLRDFDAEKSMSRSFKMATRLLENALKDAEKGYEIEDEMRRRIPIKTIMECIEKAGRYWTTYTKAKKDSGNTGGAAKIDYKEMAKIYMGAKDEGVPYDAKGHMKAVIEEVSRQQADISEESEA